MKNKSNSFAIWKKHQKNLNSKRTESLTVFLKNKMENSGVTFSSLGYVLPADVSSIIIEDYFINIEGYAKSVIERTEGMDGLSGSDKHEKILLDLSMEFLDAMKWGAVAEAENLLEAGVNINFQHPETGFTALHYSVAYSPKSLKFLFNQPECDHLIRCNQGHIPYSHSLRGSNKVAIRALRMKANQQAKNQGYSSLASFLNPENTIVNE